MTKYEALLANWAELHKQARLRPRFAPNTNWKTPAPPDPRTLRHALAALRDGARAFAETEWGTIDGDTAERWGHPEWAGAAIYCSRNELVRLVGAGPAARILLATQTQIDRMEALRSLVQLMRARAFHSTILGKHVRANRQLWIAADLEFAAALTDEELDRMRDAAASEALRTQAARGAYAKSRQTSEFLRSAVDEFFRRTEAGEKISADRFARELDQKSSDAPGRVVPRTVTRAISKARNLRKKRGRSSP